MEGNCNHTDSILNRNGRDQQQRFNPWLSPANIKLHDLDIEDWILFAYNFAKHIQYYDTKTGSVSGDWQEFFQYFGFTDDTIPLRGTVAYEQLKQEIKKTVAQESEKGEVTPHITLFICFLQLLGLSQKRFNGLTKRHLDFYYKEILQVDKKAPQPDQAHILFEIAKKSIQERISKGTELDGGKDGSGKKRIYKTRDEIVANRSQIASLKNKYISNDGKTVKISPVANSYGGNGEDFPDDDASWWPFGYPSSESNYPELLEPTIGFSLASPMLALQEGERIVTVTVTFIESLPVLTSGWQSLIAVFATGEEGWLGAFNLNTGTSKINDNMLILQLTIPPEDPAIIGYQESIFQERYNTDEPMFKFTFVPTSAGFDLYETIADRAINEITIKTEVNGITSLLLENDTGFINQKKPFYPFTTRPIIRSNFSINYAEVFQKKWNKIVLDGDWKDTPTNFNDLYKKYGDDYKDITNEDFTADVEILDKEVWKDAIEDEINLFPAEKAKDSDIFKLPKVSIFGKDSYAIGNSGPLRLSLNQSFLHDIFPKIYAIKIAQAIQDPTLSDKVPAEPYTPLLENFTLNYIAEETQSFNVYTEQGYKNRRISLFQEEAFGHREEHSYLKKKNVDQEILDERAMNLISQMLREGESEATAIGQVAKPTLVKGDQKGSLYIGLEDVEPGQQISLLVQVLEGSENTDVESFIGKEKITWSVLCNNYWKDLQDDIISNETDNFLNSGIIRFSIPKEATQNNTLFSEELLWIKASIDKSFDAVSKVKAIHNQAVIAYFEDRGNEISHLETSLPAETISKLITRVPQIKSITQPYNSFGGKPEEKDEAYYRRISERLRHKNRAITLWDYENLILQEFPVIYQVKCLNHTYAEKTPYSFMQPGNVTMVVIPDTIDKNVFDVFQPRVSKAVLNAIKNFVDALNSMQVNTWVINPTYEEVEVILSVQFYEQFDEVFYKKQLSEDITKFLSPWAFDTSRSIDFGITLQRSILIDYLENLPYVDYLQDITIKHNGVESENSIEPSSAASILVSAKRHVIDTDVSTCKLSTNKQLQETL